MSTPNEDALNCADAMELVHGAGHADAVRHIRRLVAENEALTNGRHALQAEGKHPAPCARFCEAKAYEVEARELKRQIAEQAALIRKQGRELGEQDALLRQALELLEDNREDVARVETTYMHKHYDPVVHAIRQHLGQKGETG